MAYDPGTIRIATTTSVYQSRLADELTTAFQIYQGAHNLPVYNVEWISLGSGAAMDAARMGRADLVCSHDYNGEMAFIGQGFAPCRKYVFYNYFVLVGPAIGNILTGPNTLQNGFKQIADVASDGAGTTNSNVYFVSRGPSGASGTYVREQQIWSWLKNHNIILNAPPSNVEDATPDDSMMGTIQDTYNRITGAAGYIPQIAYTMTDRGTWYAFVFSVIDNPAPNPNPPMVMLTSPNDQPDPPAIPPSGTPETLPRDPMASNQYVLMAINDDAPFVQDPETPLIPPPYPINTVGAQAFLTWMLTTSGDNNAKDTVNDFNPDGVHQGFIYNAYPDTERFPDTTDLIPNPV